MSLVLSETEGKCHSIKQRSSTAMPWTLWIRELCPEGGCAGCCRTHVSIPGPIHEMPVISSPRHPYPAMTTSSVQLVSRVQLCDPMDCSTPGFPVHHQLPELAQTHVHLILCHPLLLLPSIFPSIRVFSNESVLHIRWPKYLSFGFRISPSN